MAADRSEVSNGLYMTVEQYFALDESSDAKYEYLDGYAYLLRPPSSFYEEDAIVDLAGGSTAHALLSMNIGHILAGALDESDCDVYTSDAKVKVAEKRYFYPDVTVACGEQDNSALTNPVLIVEVLSPTTEKKDRGTKFKAYRTLPTLQEYVLIASQSKAIEVYRREGLFWKQYSYHEGDTIELTSVGVSFSFERVYRRVRLP